MDILTYPERLSSQMYSGGSLSQGGPQEGGRSRRGTQQQEELKSSTPLPVSWRLSLLLAAKTSSYYIGGQTRADFFKSLHESAKSASGKLFTDFLQTFSMPLCADFLHTFSVDQLLSCTLFAHSGFLHTFCSK